MKRDGFDIRAELYESHWRRATAMGVAFGLARRFPRWRITVSVERCGSAFVVARVSSPVGHGRAAFAASLEWFRYFKGNAVEDIGRELVAAGAPYAATRP